MERDAAEQIVDTILMDLDDRRGLKREWRAYDAATQRHIRDVWIEIVRHGGRPGAYAPIQSEEVFRSPAG